jgi:hypothetical protein
MKEIYIILIAMFILNVAKAQDYIVQNTINAEFNQIFKSSLKANNQSIQKNADFADSKSSTWRYDTIITFDSLDVFLYRYTQTFDMNGNIVTNKVEEWMDYFWFARQEESFTYDINGNQISSLKVLIIRANNSDIFIESEKITSTYDIKGKKLTKLMESIVGTIDIKNTYSYDIKGNLQTQLNEINIRLTEVLNDNWMNVSKFTYTYDNYGKILTELKENWKVEDAWEKKTKKVYTYDKSNNILVLLSKKWQSDTWTDTLKSTYTYDGSGNKLMDLCEFWLNNTWANSFRHNFTYDINGNMLSDLIEVWLNDNWINNERYTYTYDVNGNSLSAKYEKWQNGIWKPNINTLMIFTSKVEIDQVFKNIYRYDASYTSFK